MKHSKRTFFKQGSVGAFLSGTPTIARTALPDPIKSKTSKAVNPLHLGMAGYTFVSFDLDTTLKMLERLGTHYLCTKDFHLPPNSTDEQIRAFHNECTVHEVAGYAVSPIYMKSKEEIDRAFDCAKRVRVKLIVGVPNYEPLPYVDKKVKEYDFRYAIYLYDPDIRTYPDATDVWRHTRDLDPYIGVCLDVGYDLRNGCNPVTDSKEYRTRVFDMHIKSVTDSSKAGVGVEIGRGEIDLPALTRMMQGVNYTGMCSLKYEKDMKDPFLRIAEPIGHFGTVSDLT